jgi:hypothetical protein
MALLRLILALFGTAVLLSGCSDPAGNSQFVFVQAHVLTPTVAVGDSAAVRIVAFNPTSSDITTNRSLVCHFHIVVYNAIGEQVQIYPGECFGPTSRLTVPARDSVEETVHWPAWRAAGDYTVIGVVLGLRGSRPHPLTIR